MKTIFHFQLMDDLDNQKSLICTLKNQKIRYTLYGGWGYSGTPFSLSNINFYDKWERGITWNNNELPIQLFDGESFSQFTNRVWQMLEHSTLKPINRINDVNPNSIELINTKDNVKDAIDYFNFRASDLKHDDRHYLNVMLGYIKKLESEVKERISYHGENDIFEWSLDNGIINQEWIDNRLKFSGEERLQSLFIEIKKWAS